jgi:RNA polymerase sigma factor (TIGR02999 family)
MSAQADLSVFDADTRSAVTRLSNSASDGDPQAAAELLPLVYEQLRNLAHEQMRDERANHTLQATALVHEAYLRLVNGGGIATFRGRWHFYAAAAEAMRRILVDRARRRSSLKRGGHLARVDIEQTSLLLPEPSEDLVALDEGLELLQATHAEKAQLVKLRYFGGLTIDEAADALGISAATANRHWAYAKAWLFRHVKGVSATIPKDARRQAASRG